MFQCLELKLLCRIAERVFSRSDIAIDSVSICNLATLLLGMLRTYTTSRKIRVEEEWVLDILRIYGSLLWRMEDVTPHIAFIGRLFGPAGTQSHPHSYSSSHSYSYSYSTIYSYSYPSFPHLAYPLIPYIWLAIISLSLLTTRPLILSPLHLYHLTAGHSLSLFNLSTVRAELAVVYTAMSKHPSSGVTPSLRLNALTIAALIAVDRKLIDSRDFAECMPVFQALGGEVKDRIALLSATASTGADTDADAMPVNKAGKLKRFRIEITEPNLIKSRKTASNPSAGAGTGNTEGEVDINEIVLDPETLTWSALLGPQGAHYLLYFISPPLNSSSSVLYPSLLFFLTYCYHSFFFPLLITISFTTLLTLSTNYTLHLCLCNLFDLIMSSSHPFLSLMVTGCSSPRQATLCMVAVHECLRCMYDSELVIRAGALSALKRLCLEAGVWSGVRASKSLNDDGYVRTVYLLYFLIFCC